MRIKTYLRNALYLISVHWADELVRNGSDFSLLSDLIACVDDLVTAESQLVLFIFEIKKKCREVVEFFWSRPPSSSSNINKVECSQMKMEATRYWLQPKYILKSSQYKLRASCEA